MSNTELIPTPQTAAGGEIMINPKRLEVIAYNRKVMKKFVQESLVPGHDYGTIPGCGDKPVLFQPGMQNIMSLVSVYPDSTVETRDLGNGHREYMVKLFLKQFGTDIPIAAGTGSCSTMEKKYRYRNADPEDTGQELPRGYWNEKNKEKQKQLLPKGTVAKKNATNKWTIHRFTGEQVENPDIADQYNTCLKIAVKRANMNAVNNMIGGWGEQFLTEDDVTPPVAPTFEDDPAAPEPTSAEELERMRADFRAWPQNKREAYERKHAELVDVGVPADDAIRQAHAHVTKYFQ